MLVATFFAIVIRNALYKYDKTAKFILPALWIKMLGAVVYACIYQFYYGGGDTFAYFEGIDKMLQSFELGFFKPLEMMWKGSNYTGRETEFLNTYYSTTETFMVVRLGVMLGFIGCRSFIVTSLLFAIVSFPGLWAMFRTFYKINPQYPFRMALATLFIPSVVFFGSPILKDTIMISCLGWLMYCLYHVLVLRQRFLFSLLCVPMVVFLMLEIKDYILYAFLPALLYWLLLELPKQLTQPVSKRLAYIASYSTLLLVAFIGVKYFVSKFTTKVIDMVIAGMASMQSYHLSLDKGATTSAYDLGKYDPTVSGVLKKAPEAIIVTFFRPLPNEVKNILMAFASVESMLVLGLTLFVVLRVNWRIPMILVKENFIVFCMIFAVIFGFFVGFASFNFGALMRYKIPCLPFYIAAMLLIHAKGVALMQKHKSKKIE